MLYAFRLPSVGSSLNLSRALLRSLMESLQMSENHGLLKRFDTAEVLGISFKMEVNKDMGSSAYCNGRLVQTSAAEMLELIPICFRQLSSLNPSFSSKMGKWSLPQGSGLTFQG